MMCKKGKKDVLVLPCTEGKLRQAETLFFELSFYKVSGAQLGVKIGNCVSCLCLGGGGNGQTFPDRRWGGLALKRLQTSVTQLPAERRGSAARQLVEKQVRRRFPDSSAVILL